MKFRDQMGKELTLKDFPKRIISLVPSQTELLFDLGLKDSIVGITKFCIHPDDKVSQLPKIGGTKKFDFGKIKELKPDLIIGNKEENYKEGIDELVARGYKVWMSDIISWQDNLDMISGIGEVTNTRNQAQQICHNIETEWQKLETLEPQNKTVLYFIWKNPYMVAGENTFINTVLDKIGVKNCTNQERYPILEVEQIRKLNPDYVWLSSEPYPFKDAHKAFFEDLLPKSKVEIVDGELFSWYGSRLTKSPNYIAYLLRKS